MIHRKSKRIMLIKTLRKERDFTMKSRILYTSLTIMLFVSVLAFGDIIEDPESTGTNANVGVSAGPGNPSPDSEYEDVWYYEYTDEAGMFSWSIYASASAETHVHEDGGWATAVASASGAATSGYSTVSASASASGENEDGPYVDSDSGYDWFDAYDGVSGMCDAFAYAAIEEGSESAAHADADSTGYASMS
jgi:hypothetical protein